MLSIPKKFTLHNIALSLAIAGLPQASFAEENTQVAAPVAEYRILPTNSRWEEKQIDSSFYDNPYQVSLFSPKNGEDSERLLDQTYTVFGLGLGVVGVLALMPEEVTNWEKSDVNLGKKWKSNVRDGPVWDRDDHVLNFIGHPYFGGVYYQSARKSGYRQWDSFLYSFMMSTFYWEYGVEAFAEVPSIQDLVVTPVLGWVYGEWAFQTERDIWQNGGTVLGSEWLGNTSLFLLDPVDSIGRNLNYLFGKDIIKAGTGYFTVQQAALPYGDEQETQIGLRLSYQYGGGDSKALPGISRKGMSYGGNTIDPVDTGIVGVSMGAFYAQPDSQWGLDSGMGYQWSLGLYFTKNFSTRLSYSRAELDQTDSSKTTTYENYSVDSQYYFNTDANLRPYLTAGIGEVMLDLDNDQKTFTVNGGLGLHYKINNNWAIQSDWRHFVSTSTDTNENLFSSAVVYRFGKGEWSL